MKPVGNCADPIAGLVLRKRRIWRGLGSMTPYRIACLVAALVVSFVVIFLLAGSLMPEFAASRLGQIVLAAVAAAAGLVLGNALQRRFFPGR